VLRRHLRRDAQLRILKREIIRTKRKKEKGYMQLAEEVIPIGGATVVLDEIVIITAAPLPSLILLF
jgi:hypothetical protein